MENLTIDNSLLCLQVMAKIAYNFWPCIAFMIAYCIWELAEDRRCLVRVRLKNKTANPNRDRHTQ
jgi:hypothetical protein